MRSTYARCLAIVGALALVCISQMVQAEEAQMSYPFKLPELGYAYNALEPYLDARTMEIHYTKHHAGYVSKLNAALKDHPEFHKYSLETILRNLDSLPEEIRTAVRNNGGGHLNHSLFWQVIKPGGKKEPHGEILNAIKDTFGSVEAFKQKFTQSAASLFGSGWTWLAMDPFSKLHVFSTSGHDSPVMDGLSPLLVLDVWEHAYYLKFQNRRADFIEAFWNVVNWDVVNQNYEKAKAEFTKK
jgi:Fe-Mn family superoxide dismutase